MHVADNDGNSSVWRGLSLVSREPLHTNRPLIFDVKSPSPSDSAGVCVAPKNGRCWMVSLWAVQTQEPQDGLLLALPLGRHRQPIAVGPPQMRTGFLQV